MKMLKKIRILHVFGSLNIGGAETLIMNLYRNMDRSKIQFDFIVHTDKIGFYEEEIKKLGGKIYHLSSYNGVNHFKYKKEWNNFFKTHKEYKIIHSHIRSTAAIILKIAKKYGLVTISHSHNTSNGRGFKSFIKKILQYRIRKISDYFMGCSFEANQWLYGKKIANSSRCFILKNGIDVDKYVFDPKIRFNVRKKLGIKNEFLIGHVGRFCYQKNQEYLIEMFSILHKVDKDAKLLLIGTGETENKIKNLIKKNKLSNNVIILKNRNDINELMFAMDCFVFPSRYEGLGIVIVEAQSAGLPCFISDTIPKSVIVTPIVKMLNITDSPNIWIQEIEKVKSYERKDYSNDVKVSGYNIKDSANFLFDFYNNII